ncbi:aldehyde dehydrogenase (NADP(+)) [Nocardioides mangrovi]|uniref:Aldehyde dehydrogenase (NADP(+)) n=1 Tax=Nocardioides mangrovi TaxID=2874580 RepID=A0ABS7UJE3_9ACTN|nr:aldehyde dehydrogenase (NADP(+)) [Nocardioides mangrovi]MBZ5740984.1 aldehyde dehydrogenase (NADP(+)) [Nocardioides mangrovi]
MSITSIDARTGEPRGASYDETSAAEVAATCAAAAAAAPGWAALSRADRAGALEDVAAALEARSAEIIATADAETALGEPRLTGELARTCFQLRFFAEVVREGSYLEATIDHADTSPMGPRPDLRRMLVPVGPVAVFGASNFPLAFSVPGGDTASALAAGCPVVVKAHEAHPATSVLCFEAMRAVLPDGVISLVLGRAAGAALVRDPHVRAVGFTGSTRGGRALADLAAARPEPIPFYGELGSVNAFVVTPAAAAVRAEEIGRGLADSFTLGAGQFCTKPGLALVPAGADGDGLRDAVTTAAEGRTFTMLTDGIRHAYETAAGRADTRAVTPTIVEVEAGELTPELLEEVFGPYLVIARYDGAADLDAAIDALPGALTATVHGEDDDRLGADLARSLPNRVGRVVWNGYPTGVSVGWAQHHGGPWPGTNTLFTSVGATAVRRFQRPVAWQSAPASVLPEELRDDHDGIPRRVDGVLHLPTT